MTMALYKKCVKFFLTTLGFKKNNDKVLRNVMQRSKNHMVAFDDGRNRGQPHNKMDDEVIRIHILSFNPTVSHYRREHAPNCMYLPSDLNFTTMFADFVAKNSHFKCSYEKYRTVAKELNISIVKLGHEECELCEKLTLHDPNHSKENLNPDCDICSK